MLKKIQEKLKDRKRQKELDRLREIMTPRPKRRPAMKSVAKK